VLTLAKSLYNDYRVGVAARYHGARAHERLGERELALAELRTVVAEDRSPTRFYGNFAKQRIALLTGELACDTPGLRSGCTAQRIDARLGELERTAEHDLEAAIGLLEPLARDFGGAYPWLGRALDWARLGEVSLAADELYETYLAFRTASRCGPIRAGRASVVKGASTLHHVADFPTLRARAQLPQSARLEIAEAARLLGDFGTTVVFGGPSLAETLPEAYASDVARVARKYGLDPDLLLAVMRVESVYQRRIISHAGAIGLMQIMPRTGRLIGVQQGRYVPATDLLDPHVNLELAGWYLRALIERMNGSLPLAIASYNGGPHNVRRWIEAYGAHLPLDAFLERIPFAETKRYVRRVLGYYARYRAERGEELDQMAFALPDDRPEIVSF
jgi:soluble lytic murein transglycosylase-like protein